MPLINYIIELVSTWSKNSIITSMEKRAVTNAPRDTSPTSVKLETTDTKFYVPVVTLSTENDKKL